MKILSFDVGIKNLAYCYSDHTNNNISILDWNVIDLVKNNNMCYHDNCHKPIKYFINDIYSCKKHASCHSDYFINHTQLSIYDAYTEYTKIQKSINDNIVSKRYFEKYLQYFYYKHITDNEVIF